jgi:hypothetical protein
MATDVTAFRAKLLQERQAVQDQIDLFDIAAERVLYDQAVTTYEAATAIADKRFRRWKLYLDKVERLAELDAQIALFT